jgi:mannose PTS system EIIA component
MTHDYYTSNQMPTTILIVAHAPLASAYLSLVKHVYTLQNKALEHIYTVDVPADEPRHITEHTIKALLLKECYVALPTPSCTNCLILTDLPGATPHNCAINACNENQKDTQPSAWCVVAPISAPLLLRAINYRHLSATTLRDKLLHEAP